MDVQQPVRVLQGRQLGGLPHGQPPGLEHGPHAAVQKDGPRGVQQFTKFHSDHLTFGIGSRPGPDSPDSCVQIG